MRLLKPTSDFQTLFRRFANGELCRLETAGHLAAASHLSLHQAAKLLDQQHHLHLTPEDASIWREEAEAGLHIAYGSTLDIIWDTEARTA